MGISHRLIAIHPERLESIISFFNSLNNISVNDVEFIVQKTELTYDCQSIRYLSEAILEKDQLLISQGLNHIIEDYSSVEIWHLEKFHRTYFCYLDGLIPELKPIQTIFTGNHFDILFPNHCSASDDGIFGAWKWNSGVILEASKMFERLSSKADLVSLVESIKLQWWQKLSRTKFQKSRLLGSIDTCEFWKHWCQVSQAIERTVNDRIHLGLGIT